MKTFSVQDIMELEPCDEYPVEVVTKLWEGKPSLSLEEILNLSIDIDDKLWVLARLVPTELLPNWANFCANEARIRANNEYDEANAQFAERAIEQAIRTNKAYRGAYYSKSATNWTEYHATLAASYAADSATNENTHGDWVEVREKELERLLNKLVEMDNELQTIKKD